MDWTALAIGAAGGVAGLVLGAVLQWFFGARYSARSEARSAALVSMDDLDRMSFAIGVVNRLEVESRIGENYDARLAIALSALNRVLTLAWWDRFRDVLLRAATAEERPTLSGAASATRGVMTMLSRIGNRGQRQIIHKAKLQAKRARARLNSQRAGRENAAPVTPGGSTEDAEDRGTPEEGEPPLEPIGDPEADAAIAAINQEAEKVRQLLASSNRQLEDYADLAKAFDPEVAMARDYLKSVVALERQLIAARAVCQRVYDSNRSPL